MKKLSVIISLLLVVLIICSCGAKTNNEEKETDPVDTTVIPEETTAPEPVLSSDPIRVFTLQGPTGMGMSKMIKDTSEKNSKLNYEFSVHMAPTEFLPDIISGNFEIAAVPTNTASVLYNKTQGAVKVAAINTLGVLYVLENGETINSVKDLEGKTIYSSGQGAVPEYALNYILDAFGVKCEVIYEAEHDTVIADIITGKADVAILPEPKVSAAMLNENKPENLRTALDLTELWEKACEKNGDDSALCMGCVVVNSNWLETHENEFNQFMKDYEESVNFVNTDESAPEVITEAGIIPKAPIAKMALEPSHIVFVDSEEMKTDLSGFLNVLFSYNPECIGSTLPADDFYIG